MLTYRKQTCCFAGHHKLPKENIENMVQRLNREIDTLISKGVTNFVSGGALGFDQIAASLILAKKEMGYNIRLIFALPCINQDELWNADQRKLYHNLLAESDAIIYVSQEHTDTCMKKSHRFMVEQSAYCICALFYPTGRTAQTVRYAKKRGLKTINIADKHG